MSKVVNFIAPLSFFSLAVRVVVCGASVGEAVAVASAALVFAAQQYLDSRREEPVNDSLKRELADVKSAVSALKIARSVGR